MTREIYATRRNESRAVLVDDADYVSLSIYRWYLHERGYAYRMESAAEYRSGPRRKILMHRQLLGLVHGDSRQGDHINGQRRDNRRANLRVVERGQNQQNVHTVSGKSVYRGVSLQPRTGRWRAQVCVDNTQHHLGYFDTEEEAGMVAAEFREKHHLGSYADYHEGAI